MGFHDALTEGSDDLNRFDTANPGDLAAFDDASGETHIPTGWYSCMIARGEVVTTKKGKTAYRLAFDVEDDPHRGFRLWRYFTFDTPAAVNRANRGYAGPAGCRYLLFDIDRRGDLAAAFADAGTLTRFVLNRYGSLMEGDWRPTSAERRGSTC